jgi:hypothetical protein
LNLGHDLVDRLDFYVIFDIFFVIFSDGSLSLARFSGRLSCFGFGLGYGSDNEPRFWADFKPLSSRKT